MNVQVVSHPEAGPTGMPEDFPNAADWRVRKALLAMAALLHGCVEPSVESPFQAERMSEHMLRIRGTLLARQRRRRQGPTAEAHALRAMGGQEVGAAAGRCDSPRTAACRPTPGGAR